MRNLMREDRNQAHRFFGFDRAHTFGDASFKKAQTIFAMKRDSD